MNQTAPKSARYQSWISRHPLLVLLTGFVLTVGSTLIASRLHLKTSFAELLPSSDPGVKALERTQKRVGDLSLLLVGIRSPDRAANEKYAELITGKLRQLPPKVCELATYNVRDLRSFFDANKWLYVAESDLEDIRDRVRSEIMRRKNPLLVSLGDDESLDDMKQRLKSKDGLSARFPDALFTDQSREFLWVAALPPGGLFVERAGESLYEAAHRIIAENPPERFHPAMHVEVGGPIATAIAQRAAVERDVVWVTIICVVVIALSIGLYFRRLRALPLVVLPGVAGTVVAFAVAYIAFGYLNSSTAFLGSIILGNGINYAIMLLSRYEEQRAAGEDPQQALRHAIAGLWRPTGAAALCSCASYASLMVTSFRGFYQFGVMAAAGVVACWVATFTLLPAMLAFLDRRAAPANSREAPLTLVPLGRLLTHHWRVVLCVAGVMGIAGLVGAAHFLSDAFEYDFRKLNAKVGQSVETQQFNTKMDALFGRWPSPTVVLADTDAEVEPIREAILRQDQEASAPKKNGKRVIGQVVTVHDLLPGTPEVQQRKLAILDDIRKLIHDPALSILTAEERRDLDRLDPPADLRVLQPTDLPPLARRPFTEVDGTVGRVVLVYPVDKNLSVWNGRDLIRIASVIQHVKLPDGKVIDTAGSAVVFGAMINSILRDGPIATGASVLTVLLLVAFAVRPRRHAGLALAALGLGIVWMLGAAGWAHVHVTFLNFIALPITIGIGVEYAVNIMARWQEDRRPVHAVIATGGAVAMCSWTTIVGYGSLLAASSRALQGFGVMAILGELACLSAAIVALPAFLLWRSRKQPETQTPPAA